MKKIHIFSRVSRRDLLDLEELFDDEDWRSKAERLQMRRWRKIRHDMA